MPDFTYMTNMMKKNAEFCTSAMQVATESTHAIFRRGAEITQNYITSSFDAMKDITSANNPEQVLAKQQEFVKNSVEDAISSTKEMIDLASKSSMEIFASVGSRFSETVNESLNNIKK
jgi:phasin family protein